MSLSFFAERARGALRTLALQREATLIVREADQHKRQQERQELMDGLREIVSQHNSMAMERDGASSSDVIRIGRLNNAGIRQHGRKAISE